MTLATITVISAFMLFSPLRWSQSALVSLQASQAQQEQAPAPAQNQPGSQDKTVPERPGQSDREQPSQPDQNAPKEQPVAPIVPQEPQTPAANQESSTEQPRKERTPAKPKPAKSKAPKKHKKTTKKVAEQPADGPTKVVVRNGSTSDPKLEFAPRLPQGEASYQRQSTTQLLSGTEEKLKSLSGRQLKPSEQATLDQIHNFMDQARAAVKAGDVQRAHTLAYKAHLLSNELFQP